jgi:hypothetical protein
MTNKERNQLYWVWASIIQRCCNPKNKAYMNYGGRGITVCESWRNSFSCFLSDMGERPKDHSIDRIDNNKGYSPENCQWVIRTIQNSNKRKYKSNIFGISGVERRAGDQSKFRVRVRHKRKIILDTTTDDFFEACCLRKSVEANVIIPFIKLSRRLNTHPRK